MASDACEVTADTAHPGPFSPDSDLLAQGDRERGAGSGAAVVSEGAVAVFRPRQRRGG